MSQRTREALAEGQRGRAVSGQTFDSLFESFERTVFRLEALPAYEVGGADAERFQAFQEGRPLSVRSVRTSPWLARIAVSTVTAGKAWSRVRVVDSELVEDPEALARMEQARLNAVANSVPLNVFLAEDVAGA